MITKGNLTGGMLVVEGYILIRVDVQGTVWNLAAIVWKTVFAGLKIFKYPGIAYVALLVAYDNHTIKSYPTYSSE